MAHRTLAVVIAGFFVALAPVALGQADLRLVFSNTNGGGCGAPCGGVSTAVYAGGVSSYAAELENAGPNTASNVTLTVTLPPTVTVDQITAYNLTCSVSQTIASTTVTCTAPSMPMALAAGAVAFVAHLPQNYPYQNGITASATLTATTADPHPADNAVTETLPVLPPQIPVAGTLMLAILVCVLGSVGVLRSFR
jgi:uncharacterized repeat protein (TIGR01451 family)